VTWQERSEPVDLFLRRDYPKPRSIGGSRIPRSHGDTANAGTVFYPGLNVARSHIPDLLVAKLRKDVDP
jgi:hypothetical protein